MLMKVNNLQQIQKNKILEMLSGSNLKHLPLTAKDIHLFCDRLVNRLKGYRACNVHNQLDFHNQNTYNLIQFWSFGNTKNVKRREKLKKKQSCIISQISHFAKDFFGRSLCLPPPFWLSPHSVSLPAHSSLPQSVGNAMESGRLCLHFICVWDRGGFPDLMLGVFEGWKK